MSCKHNFDNFGDSDFFSCRKDEPPLRHLLKPQSVKTLKVFFYAMVILSLLCMVLFFLPTKILLLFLLILCFSCLFASVYEAGYRLDNKFKFLYSQVESCVWIFNRFNFRFPVEPMRGWAVSPDAQRFVCKFLLDLQPNLVVEIGSGVSTIINGYTLRETGKGKLVSLENNNLHAEKIEYDLKLHGLSEICEVSLQPKGEVSIRGDIFDWYLLDEKMFEKNSIQVLFVDGPSGPLNKEVRYPALPILFDYLAEESWVILDDAVRTAERNIIQKWSKEFPIRSISYHNMEKGLCVLEIKKRI